MNIFTAVKYCCILQGRDCVLKTNMHKQTLPVGYLSVYDFVILSVRSLSRTYIRLKYFEGVFEKPKHSLIWARLERIRYVNT